MKFPISPITASEFGDDVSGDPRALADHVANLENAESDCLAFCLARHLSSLAVLEAAVILAPRHLRNTVNVHAAQAVVWVENPQALFVDILVRNGYGNPPSPGWVAEGGYFMAEDAAVGDGTEIFPMASIHAGTVIGVKCRIQSAAVLGSIGLAYAESEGSYVRFPHLGRVVLGNNVDIGAGSVIVRGILQDTIVGSGTRIGNGVNVGHNVEIGRNCFISSGATLAGSVKLEDNVWVAPKAVVLNGITVGHGARIAPGAVVVKKAQAFYLYAGNPARAIRKITVTLKGRNNEWL